MLLMHEGCGSRYRPSQPRVPGYPFATGGRRVLAVGFLLRVTLKANLVLAGMGTNRILHIVHAVTAATTHLTLSVFTSSPRHAHICIVTFGAYAVLFMHGVIAIWPESDDRVLLASGESRIGVIAPGAMANLALLRRHRRRWIRRPPVRSTENAQHVGRVMTRQARFGPTSCVLPGPRGVFLADYGRGKQCQTDSTEHYKTDKRLPVRTDECCGHAASSWIPTRGPHDRYCNSDHRTRSRRSRIAGGSQSRCDGTRSNCSVEARDPTSDARLSVSCGNPDNSAPLHRGDYRPTQSPRASGNDNPYRYYFVRLHLRPRERPATMGSLPHRQSGKREYSPGHDRIRSHSVRKANADYPGSHVGYPP